MMRTIELKRIGLLSAAIRGCIVCSITGFLAGLAGAFWMALLASTITVATGIDVTGAGYAMLVAVPFAGLFAGAVAGTGVVALVVFVYNLTAGLFGGVTVEIEGGRGASPAVSAPGTGDHPQDGRIPPSTTGYLI